jgi:hypothetical protein
MKLTKLLTTTGAFCLLAFGLLTTTPTASQAQNSGAVGGSKRCTDYWTAHKTELKAQGKTRKTFMGPCLSGAWMFW